MDILVTTPKSAHRLAVREAKWVESHSGAYWFRTINGTPNVQIGDKVYYVDQGEIRGYGIVFDIVFGEIKCHSTGKVYTGTHLKQRKWVCLEKPIPFRGFQGFRYINRIPELQKKLKTGENKI